LDGSRYSAAIDPLLRGGSKRISCLGACQEAPIDKARQPAWRISRPIDRNKRPLERQGNRLAGFTHWVPHGRSL